MNPPTDPVTRAEQRLAELKQLLQQQQKAVQTLVDTMSRPVIIQKIGPGKFSRRLES